MLENLDGEEMEDGDEDDEDDSDMLVLAKVSELGRSSRS